jgi:hypothetical protein
LVGNNKHRESGSPSKDHRLSIPNIHGDFHYGISNTRHSIRSPIQSAIIYLPNNLSNPRTTKLIPSPTFLATYTEFGVATKASIYSALSIKTLMVSGFRNLATVMSAYLGTMTLKR